MIYVNIHVQHPITHKLMAWLNVSIDISNLLLRPNPTLMPGWILFLSFSLASGHHSNKISCNSTAAEKVYGTTLSLPGEFIHPSSNTSFSDTSQFLTQLKTHFHTLQPILHCLQLPHSSIPHTLSTATHVFVRHDVVRKPLQPPYDGVIKRTEKQFTLNINGRNNTVSIDRLKLAHIDHAHPPPQLQPHSSLLPSTTPPPPQPSHTPVAPTTPTATTCTRSGCHVQFPSYLSHNV